MFIVITKKRIIAILLAVLALLLLTFLVFLIKSWDLLIIHRYMPEPETNPIPESSGYRYTAESFTPLPEGYSVLVDLDTLVLTLYKDAAPFKSWPVSGGSKENPSPTGAWIVSDIGNWGEGFGGSWIALNVPWGKYGIHGTVEPWAVGSSNISHGCIRMKNADVAELKQYMSWGVPVYIKYDGAPFRALKDGKAGSDVLRLQEMLGLLGYYEGSFDGRFGSGTRKALLRFQTEERIKADGIVGWETWNLLNERVAELENPVTEAEPAS